MTPSATANSRRIPLPLTAALAILLSNAGLASAQTSRIETLFGGFDPLEAVPLDEAWALHPTALATDAGGSLYLVDQGAFRVRKVDRSGRVSTVAGSGLLGYSGDWGPATSARLGNRVEGLVVDGEGNVYRAGTVAPNPAGGCIGNNHHVRRHGRIGRGRRRRACHRGRAQRALSSARLAAARRSRCPGLLATALSQSRR